MSVPTEPAAVAEAEPTLSDGGAAVPTPRARDWLAWYDDLEPRARREMRDRLLTATPDEVKADPELRTFFLFHAEDLIAEDVPGTGRLHQLHEIVMVLRGRAEPEMAEQRRKAVQFLLAEYQAVLRDNPFLT